MISINRILFPTDLTPASEKVAPYVTYMADKLSAEVLVFHVVRRLENFGFIGLDADDYVERLSSYQKELEERISDELDAFVQRNFGGLNQMSYALVEGEPAEEIILEAEKREVGLIIMGTHRRKGFTKVMFGSVASAVVVTAPCPVMTVNPFGMAN